MHEFSIAEAVLGQVREHAPPGTRVREVHLRAGALQMIDPEALAMAWTACSQETELRDCRLILHELSPRRKCRSCGRTWTGTLTPEPCTCGSTDVDWPEADTLLLESLEVDDPETDNPADIDADTDQHAAPRAAITQGAGHAGPGS